MGCKNSKKAGKGSKKGTQGTLPQGNEAVVNHSSTTQEHELEIDGFKLKETRILDHLQREGEEEPYQTTLVHTRVINDNYYSVVEVTENGKVTRHDVNTSLSDDQIEGFDREWEEKWKPGMDEEEVTHEAVVEAAEDEIWEELDHPEDHTEQDLEVSVEQIYKVVEHAKEEICEAVADAKKEISETVTEAKEEIHKAVDHAKEAKKH